MKKDRADKIYKANPSRGLRGLRMALSVLDPRAWFGLVRLLNHLNQTHVIPRRKLSLAKPHNISADVNFSNAERIFAGPGLRIGAGCFIWAGPGMGRIEFGQNVLLGPRVFITCARYQFEAGQPVTEQPMAEADVVIGDDVWIGASAIILPGSKIGHGAIIAAGSVVRGVIPDMAIMAGVPVRQVGRRSFSAQ